MNNGTAKAETHDHILVRMAGCDYGMSVSEAESLANSISLAIRDAIRKGVKPCPFCKANREGLRLITDGEDRLRLRYFMQCQVCNSRGPEGESEGEAIRRWGAGLIATEARKAFPTV